MIFSFVFFSFLAQSFTDRTLMTCGLLLIKIGILVGIVYLQFLIEYNVHGHIFMGILFVLNVLGLPAVFISSAALFTKLMDDDVQGLGQGLLRGALGIGTILGSLLTGPFIKQPTFVFATIGLLVLVLLLLILFNFSKLKSNEEEELLDELSD